MNFVVFRVIRKNYQLISQKLHFPRPNSSKLFLQNRHAKLVLTDRVHWSSATIRVAPLYWTCGRVAYLRVAFPCHIASIMLEFCVFNDVWLEKPAYKHWLRKDGTSYRRLFAQCARRLLISLPWEKEFLPVTARVSDFQELKLASVEYSGLRWR